MFNIGKVNIVGYVLVLVVFVKVGTIGFDGFEGTGLHNQAERRVNHLLQHHQVAGACKSRA